MGVVHALMMIVAVVDNDDHNVDIHHALVQLYWWIDDDYHLSKIHLLNVLNGVDDHFLVNDDDVHCHYYSDDGCDDDDETCFLAALLLLHSYDDLSVMLIYPC